MDQDLIVYLDRQFASIGQRFEKLETEVRHAHVAIEDLRDKVKLTAEGVANVSEQLKQYKAETDLNISTLRSFNQLCYQDLDTRVRRLEAAG